VSYPTRKLEWDSWRIIPSRNPPVDLYRRVAPEQDWKTIVNVELLTNPRVREMREGLGLVRPEDMEGGRTQNWILAPFTYLNPEGSRFSDGTYGACFLAKDLGTALLESIRLRQQFLQRTAQEEIRLDMRVIKTALSGHFDDSSKVRNFDSEREKKNYWKARQLDGCDGAHFQSGELQNGECVEAFRPRVMRNAIQERHLTYSWDGQSIHKVYDFSNGKDIDLKQLRESGRVHYVENEQIRAIHITAK
jgi:hypothetical protein